MNKEPEIFEVRDFRTKEFFQIDDVYLNGYAKICGIYATGVYLSLCRHADKTQKAFPSVELISEELGISKNSVLRAIKILSDHNIIKRERKRTKEGVFLSNVYVLIDKKYWEKEAQVSVGDLGNQVPMGDLVGGYTQVSVGDSKYTQRVKDTHIIAKEVPFYKKFEYLRNLPEEEVTKLMKEHECSREQIIVLGKTSANYLDANGKKKTNYRAYLSNWIENDKKYHPNEYKRDGGFTMIRE